MPPALPRAAAFALAAIHPQKHFQDTFGPCLSEGFKPFPQRIDGADERLYIDQFLLQQTQGWGKGPTTGADKGHFVDDDGAEVHLHITVKGTFENEMPSRYNHLPGGGEATGVASAVNDHIGSDALRVIG